MVINGAHSERHAYLDTIIQELIANLATNDGLAENINQAGRHLFSHEAEELFVPDYHDGILSIPEAYLEHGTPIIALQRDEAPVLGEGFGRLIADQESAICEEIERRLGSDTGASAVCRALSSGLRLAEGKRSLPAANMTVHARVTGIAVKLTPQASVARPVFVSARPLVVIYPDGEQQFKPRPDSASKLFHELVHVRQQKKCPVLDAESDAHRRSVIASELEAYHAEVTYAQGLVRSSDPRYHGNMSVASAPAFRVERLRSQYAAFGDPFAVSNELIDALEENELISMLLTENGSI